MIANELQAEMLVCPWCGHVHEMDVWLFGGQPVCDCAQVEGFHCENCGRMMLASELETAQKVLINIDVKLAVYQHSGIAYAYFCGSEAVGKGWLRVLSRALRQYLREVHNGGK